MLDTLDGELGFSHASVDFGHHVMGETLGFANPI